MNDREILDRLWEEYSETPFASLTMQRKLDLRPQEDTATRKLLGDMSDSGEVRNGYRIKRVASTMYKLISQGESDSDSEKGVDNTQAASTTHKATQAQQSDSDSVKGKLLIDPKESLTEANTASFDEQSPEIADFSINDPFPAVPAELKARPQWVVWLYHLKPGEDKPSKMLYQTNGWASLTSNPRTWTTYRLALSCYQEHTEGQSFEYRYRENRKAPYQHLKCNLAGIGFVFSEDDPYCGIDLDDCLDAQGELKDWAKPIVDRIKGVGYGERSPSGNGIKFWTRATLPPEAKHKAYIVEGADAIEAYDRVRYFTVTGRGKGNIGDGQAVIDWLVQEYLSEPQRPTQNTERQPPPTKNLNAGEVIERIRASRQSAKFEALMRGNTTGYGSQSEADLALCSVIAFWSQETAAIDAVFRQSGLMRAKWDERHRGDGSTYGQMTIEEALSGSRETYTQPRGKPYRRSLTSAARRNL